jgi:hypothetical protein
VNTADACKMLETIFQWAIDEKKLELRNCPVIVLGHALKNDFMALSQTPSVKSRCSIWW